ncbi:MAG: hypothetical protein R3C59_11455 [Planctomycetaceae bacterium]
MPKVAWLRIIWNNINLTKIADRDLTPEEVDEVIQCPYDVTISRASGRRLHFGYTSTGRYIGVPLDIIDEDSVYPVTAFDAQEPVE